MLKIRKSCLIAKIIKLNPSKINLRSKYTNNITKIDLPTNKAVIKRATAKT